MGKPYVSCSWKAWSPRMTSAPLRLVSSTAASKIALPVRSVPRKAASSASITVWMCGASRRSSGYWSPSASMATEASSCR